MLTRYPLDGVFFNIAAFRLWAIGHAAYWWTIEDLADIHDVHLPSQALVGGVDGHDSTTRLQRA
ncbi:MAG TPA: hypothetical protein VMW24_01975 [Sedimentisphaerales bacterium]|nr:hypothetical protein [Sedimentisphaerales bacterium]